MRGKRRQDYTHSVLVAMWRSLLYSVRPRCPLCLCSSTAFSTTEAQRKHRGSTETDNVKLPALMLKRRTEISRRDRLSRRNSVTLLEWQRFTKKQNWNSIQSASEATGVDATYRGIHRNQIVQATTTRHNFNSRGVLLIRTPPWRAVTCHRFILAGQSQHSSVPI